MNLRKTLLLAAVLLLAPAGEAVAQKTATATGQARIEVIAKLELTKNAAVNFGQIFNNGDQRVVLNTSDGTVTGANAAQGSAALGKFTASGQHGTDITVTYDGSVTLTGPGASLTFTPDLVGSTSDNGATAGSGATGVPSGESVTTNGAGDYFFWIGGEIPVANGQQQGDYSGTFNLQVQYPGL